MTDRDALTALRAEWRNRVTELESAHPYSSVAGRAAELKRCIVRLDAVIAALAVSPETPLWQHAIRECNEAHAALDKAGARKTTLVHNRNGDGKQEITIGLADRIRSLALSGEGRTPQEQDDSDDETLADWTPKFTVWLVRDGDSWPMLVDTVWTSQVDAEARATVRGGKWRAQKYSHLQPPSTPTAPKEPR